MITKHFFKVLVIFTGIILLGLAGIFLVSYFDKGEVGADNTTDTTSQ